MYRDRIAACPTCRAALVSAGSVRGCRACEGVWATEQVLTEMVWNIHDGAETEPLVFQSRTGEPRPCPECEKPMTPELLERVPVDRCRVHGVWLDGGELQRTLQNAAERPPRSDGVKLDLRPVSERHDEYGRLRVRDREQHLRAWFAASVRVVEAETIGVGDRIVGEALAPVLASLRARPAALPTSDAAVAFAGRVEAALQFPATTPQARYLHAAKPLLDAWCIAYGVLAQGFGRLAVDAGALGSYLAALRAAVDRADEIVVLDTSLVLPHRRLADLLRSQRDTLAAVFEHAHRREATETRRHLERFVALFVDTAEALGAVTAHV